MDKLIKGVARFHADASPRQRGLYRTLARNGQAPKALVISCSDSRVIPEAFTQSDPGDIFVVRNAGNIVPPFDDTTSGVTAAIEYAVVGLKVEHIVVCGHSDCGAMKALLNRSALAEMPSVARWLHHAECACSILHRAHGSDHDDPKEAARLLAMENVRAQITHLRTHPCVAARVTTGEIALHGWLFDIESGDVLALDGEGRRFAPIGEGEPLPVALDGDDRVIEAPHRLAAAE